MDRSTNIVGAFSLDQVERLTTLSRRQLAYWDKIGFFRPSHAAENRRSPYSRIYSFQDVVGLRTVAILQGRHGVSLKHLREVAAKLERYSSAPWSDLTLKVWNRKVQIVEPATGNTLGVLDGQYFLLPIGSIVEDVRAEAERMSRRTSDQLGKIERRRFVARNAPVIAGTRVRVDAIRHYLEDGYTTSQILDEYPTLTEADIVAVAEAARAA